MTPTHVRWLAPDVDRRRAAQGAVDRDMMTLNRLDAPHELQAFARHLALARSDDAQRALWVDRYPDLNATVERRGILLGVAHQPEQWGLQSASAHAASRPIKLCDAGWTALVMTEEGCVEVDPTTLRPAP